MLRVTAILEGGLDLEKGEEIPRSIVVTNGKKVVTIPVPDSKVQELIGMFAEELKKADKKQGPAPEVEALVSERPARPAARQVLQTRPLFEMEPEPEPPIAPTLDDGSFEPGEEYDDSGTGVSSV